MHPAQRRVIDWALYQYPRLVREHKARKEWLVAVYGYSSPSDHSQLELLGTDIQKTSANIGVQERIVTLEEQDLHLQTLRCQIVTIEQGLDCLNDEERRLVEYKYERQFENNRCMEELGMSRRTYFRALDDMRDILAPFILGPFGKMINPIMQG